MLRTSLSFAKMSVQVSSRAWGISNGKIAELISLKNDSGMEVLLSTYGATITSVKVPSSSNPKNAEEVTLCTGDSIESLMANGNYYGCTVGRVANRIAKGSFVVQGRSYSTVLNNNGNTLHGGMVGYDKRIWGSTLFATSNEAGVKFSLFSHDGDEGFPGAINVTAEYSLTAKNEIKMIFKANNATRDTPINLVNHAYWNLSGNLKNNIKDHVLKLHTPFYTPVDNTQIPTEVLPVANTPFDFHSAPVRIGDRIPLIDGGGEPGIDHNFCRSQKSEDGWKLGLGVVAELSDPASGRKMVVSTSAPGVQLYTGNFLGKGPAPFIQHHALCLETQNYPDAVNRKDFPNAILGPGQEYIHEVVHAFSW
jgi:aldose 1-epimerase